VQASVVVGKSNTNRHIQERPNTMKHMRKELTSYFKSIAYRMTILKQSLNLHDLRKSFMRDNPNQCCPSDNVDKDESSDMDKWEVFVALSDDECCPGIEESHHINFGNDENEARKEYEAYVGSDDTVMLTNNGKLIAVYGRGYYARR
jgi:hypothetical protein